VTGAAGGEVMEIKIKREIPEKGFWRYFWIGMQAIMRSGLRPLEKNPNDYDLIFLGGPVWAGNFAPAIRSFLEKTKLKNKKIALFCIHGGDDPGQAIVNLEKELSGNEIVGKIDFQMDGIADAQLAENLRKAGEWARGIAGK